FASDSRAAPSPIPTVCSARSADATPRSSTATAGDMIAVDVGTLGLLLVSAPALWSAVGFDDPAESKLLESAIARTSAIELLDAARVSEALAQASLPITPPPDRDRSEEH